MVLLDPEAQHFALSGLTELPFTVLYLAALLGLARGAGVAYPFVFGLLLGVAGLFRANMLWLAPLFALGSAWCAPAGRRVPVALGVLGGFVLPLVPWWIYKWRAFGSPGWDITRYVIWDHRGLVFWGTDRASQPLSDYLWTCYRQVAAFDLYLVLERRADSC